MAAAVRMSSVETSDRPLQPGAGSAYEEYGEAGGWIRASSSYVSGMERGRGA
jgi:hypothetical protein